MLKLYCNKETAIFKNERKLYIKYLTQFMSDKIYIRYVIYKNKTNYSLNDIYNECLDAEILDNKELKNLYSKVFKDLYKRYNLKVLNSKDESIPIKLSKI